LRACGGSRIREQVNLEFIRGLSHPRPVEKNKSGLAIASGRQRADDRQLSV
jgi:hypothetical protein